MSWSLKPYQFKIMEGTRNNLGIEQYCENRDAEKSKYRLGFISALIFITSSYKIICAVFYKFVHSIGKKVQKEKTFK